MRTLRGGAPLDVFPRPFSPIEKRYFALAKNIKKKKKRKKRKKESDCICTHTYCERIQEKFKKHWILKILLL